LLGHEAVACVLGGYTVITLAAVFVLGKREQHIKLEEKRSNLGNPTHQPSNI